MHRMVLLLACVVPLARGAGAQEVALSERGPRFLLASSGREGAVEIDPAKAPIFQRRVTLALEHATVGEALAAVSRQAGIRLVYSRDALDPTAPVRIRVEGITVAAALTEILLGAGVDVVLSDLNRLTLAPRRLPPVPPTGAVAGRVTHAESGEPIEGAEVLLEGTRWRTLTGADGQFRIADVDTGRYVATARRIGFARQSRSLTVSEGQEVTADFALRPAPTKLEEVVVTGTLIPTEVKALPTPITVITAEEVERHHIRRIEDAIRLAVPGATVWDQSDNPAGVMQVSLRGTSGIGSGNSPKYYIDGIETTGRATTWLDPESIERVEVVRGPQAAAIYGSDAMGGVVQVFTKRGGGQQRPQVEARAALGMVESAFTDGVLRQEYNASLHGQSGSASYRLGGGYTRTGEWMPDYGQSTPSAYGGVRVGQGSFTLDLSARYYELNTEASTDPRFREAAPVFFPAEHAYTPFRSRDETYAVQLEYRPTGWWQHNVTAGVDRYSLNVSQTRPRLTTPADTFLLNNVQHGRRATLRYTTAVRTPLGPSLTANVTAGVDHQSLATDLTIATATRTTGLLSIDPGSFLIVSRSRGTNTGVFGQAQLNVGERLFVTGAVRGEWNSDFGDDLGVPLSPRAGLTYVQDLGTTTVKLRAAYGEAIRPPFPGAKEGAVNPFFVTLPNSLLKPERQVGPDAGIDLVFGERGSLSVTYYDQIVKDLIESVTLDATSFLNVGQFQNISRVRNEGWEFEGSLRLGQVALVRGQYAVSRSEAEQLSPSYAGDVKVGEQMISIPRQTGSVTLTAAPPRRTSVAAAMTYTGRWTFYDFLAFYGCLGGTGACNGFALGDYLKEYPAFAQLNLAIEQQVSPFVSGYVSVEDLLDSGSGRSGGNNQTAMGRITTVGARVRY